MKNKTRTYFRVITPSSFSNLNADTLEAARALKINFGICKNNKAAAEQIAYWKEQGQLCKIVKVTEIVEEIKL